MAKTCRRCKRLLAIREFGPNAHELDKHHFYCRHCAGELARARADETLEKNVRRLYEGRCTMCNGVENLEIVSAFETKRRNPKAMVLVCSACKRDGTPTILGYLRNCFRCNHQWLARKQTLVAVACPKCKSPYWNIPRR